MAEKNFDLTKTLNQLYHSGQIEHYKCGLFSDDLKNKSFWFALGFCAGFAVCCLWFLFLIETIIEPELIEQVKGFLK